MASLYSCITAINFFDITWHGPRSTLKRLFAHSISLLEYENISVFSCSTARDIEDVRYPDYLQARNLLQLTEIFYTM